VIAASDVFARQHILLAALSISSVPFKHECYIQCGSRTALAYRPRALVHGRDAKMSALPYKACAAEDD